MSGDDAAPRAGFRLDWPEAPTVPGRPAAPVAPVAEDVELAWTADPDPHQACREEIERLQALVAELRAEMKTLRRKAQLRSPR